MADDTGELAAIHREPQVFENRRRSARRRIALRDAFERDEPVGHELTAVPLMPAQAGIQFFGPGVPAFAGTSGECATLVIASLRKRDEPPDAGEHLVEQHADE